MLAWRTQELLSHVRASMEESRQEAVAQIERRCEEVGSGFVQTMQEQARQLRSNLTLVADSAVSKMRAFNDSIHARQEEMKQMLVARVDETAAQARQELEGLRAEVAKDMKLRLHVFQTELDKTMSKAVTLANTTSQRCEEIEVQVGGVPGRGPQRSARAASVLTQCACTNRWRTRDERSP